MRALLTPRSVLFLLIALLSVVLGFFSFTPETAVRLVGQFGYWVILGTFVWWVVTLVNLWRTRLPGWQWTRDHTWLTAAVLIAGALSLLHSPIVFKVYNDELVLAATGMNMHLRREAFAPAMMHNVSGYLIELFNAVDKRPLFFPFLQSVMHDLTGYRPGNVFFLNAVISFLFLSMVAWAGHQLARLWGGLVAVALVAGVPLFSESATGGGFDLLNILFILVVMVAAAAYVRKPECMVRLDFLLLSTVLLAQIRYESVLFVPATGLLVLWTWWRTRNVQLSVATLCAPLLLLLVPLQMKVFKVREDLWQLQGQDRPPFALSNLPDNVGHAMAYFLDTSTAGQNSLLLTLLGVPALIALPLLLRRRAARSPETQTLLAVTGWFGGFIVLNFFLLLCYYWGQLDDYVATRLVFPLLLLMLIGAIALLADFGIRKRGWCVVFGLSLVGMLPGISRSARADAFHTTSGSREGIHRLRFVEERSGERALWLTSHLMPALLHREAAMTLQQANARAAQIGFHLRARTYSKVYVVQRMAMSPVTQTHVPTYLQEIAPEFELTILDEVQIDAFHIIRLSEVKQIHVELPPVNAQPLEKWTEGIPEALIQNLP